MATAIKIYSTDTNQNMVSKTVSNANPAVSDYVLKNFSQQLVSLSENSFSRAERIDTTDITNATETATETETDARFAFNTTSPFASTDPSVFRAAVENLDSADMGNITFQVGSDNAAVIAVSDLKTWADRNTNFNVETFANVINQRLFNPQTGEKLAIFSAENGIYHWDFRNAAEDTYIIQIYANDSAGYEFIDSLYDGATDKSDFSGSQGGRSYSADFTKEG